MDNASPALHAALSSSFPSLRGVALGTCHLPMKRGRGLTSRFSRLQDAPSACQQVLRVLPFGGLPGRGRGERNRQFIGDEVFLYDHLCHASLPREHIDAAVASTKSAEVWSGLAEWIRAPAGVATLYNEEMKNKHSRKGTSRLRLLMAAATFPRYQWYLNNARLRSAVPGQQAALGTGTEAFSGRRKIYGAHTQAEA